MYSSMLTQNEGDLYKAAGYSPLASQMQAPPQPTSSVVTPAPEPAAVPGSEPGQGGQQQMWQKLGSMIGSGGGAVQQPTPLRSSAFGTGVQSDAPQTNTQAHMKGRAGKVMEVIGAIFSFGGTKAMSQGSQNAQAGG